MSTTITFNGSSYTVPAIGDASWGNNVSNYLIAIATGCLQKTGGSFTLTAETDFGATYGLKSVYVKGRTTNPASAGVVRLAKTDSIGWRNNANGADLALGINGSDVLQFNSISLADLSSAQTLTNKTMDGGSNTFTNLPATGLTGLVGPANGGTGVANNSASTITISGSFGTTFTVTGATSLTLPTSGTVTTIAGSQTLTNKTLLDGSTIIGNTSDASKALVFSLGGATTAKTMTLLSSHTNARTLTLPDATDTVVGKATTDTLTNKTLSGNTAVTLVSGSGTLTLNTSGTVTLPNATDTLVGKATTDTMTNKTLSSPTITGASATAIASLGLRDTSAAFDVTLAATSSTTISAGRTVTIDVQNTSKTIKITPLSNFSTLSDGTNGQVLTTSGSGSGYSWASALTTALNTKNVYIGNPSNVITATDTSLLGDILATTKSATFTITIAAPGVATLTGHGLLTGDAVYLTNSGGALPTGLAVSTTYWVIKIDADSFKLATTFANAIAGTAINTSGSQSGTHTCVSGGLITWKQGTRGVIDGGDATAGYINEEIISFVGSGSAVSLSNNVTANITSITLTPGDWDITGAVTFSGSLTGTVLAMGIDTTTANLPSSTLIPQRRIDTPTMPTSSSSMTISVPRYRVSISSSTTYYLVAVAVYSGGSALGNGLLSARRRR